ncbi:ribonuclease H-like domain-containing protein [Tanacetum coccineum]
MLGKKWSPNDEDWVSESKEEDVRKIKTIEMFNKPSFAKINFVKSTEQETEPILKITEELWRFVAFGENSKGGKISGKDFKLTDESHVLLKIPRKDNMYSVDLKNIIPQGGLTCLFAKATPDESNLWHRRLGHVNFKTMNKLVREILCPVIILNTKDHLDPSFSSSSKDSPDAGFKPSGEEEKKDAEDQGNESGNPTKEKDSEVSSTEEPRINQDKDDYINNTNNINTASDGNNTGSEVNAVDPKTSIELPNDPNMPELKDIVYSDDDEDVGAEADINNLDTHIPVSPIPTTRIHKDLPVEQII